MNKTILQRLAAACFLIAAASTATGGDFPIKQYDLGMAFDILPSEIKASCDSELEKICYLENPPDSIAGHPLTGQLLVFHQDKSGVHRLESMLFVFKALHYNDIKMAVTSKFGKFKCQMDEVTHVSGKKIQLEVCDKTGRSGDRIAITEFYSNPTEGAVNVSTKNYIIRADRELEEEAAQRAGDI